MKNSFQQKKSGIFEDLKPWIGSVVLLPIMIYFAINRGEFTLIDYFNLLIHEGGHGVFKIFGKFIYTLGGSLMQVKDSVRNFRWYG